MGDSATSLCHDRKSLPVQGISCSGALGAGPVADFKALGAAVPAAW